MSDMFRLDSKHCLSHVFSGMQSINFRYTIASLKLFTLHCFNPGRMPIWSISKQHWRCRCCRCCKWVKGESNESTMKSLFEPNIQLLSHSLWVSDFSLDHFRTFLLFLQRSDTLCKVPEALQEAEVQLRKQGQADGEGNATSLVKWSDHQITQFFPHVEKQPFYNGCS